jgi:hypothetical protein
MALRVVGWKSKRTADPDERVLVTLIQQDGSGKLVTEQGLWDASKITADDMKMLEHMQSRQDDVYPKQLLARFSQMRTRCEVPNEAAKNKLIKEHFTIYISNKNDVFVDEESSSSEEEEEEESEEEEEDSAGGSE